MAGRALVALATAVLLTASCAAGRQGDDGLGRPEPSETSTRRIPSSASVAPSTTADSTATSTTSPQAAQVVLGPEGLGAVAFGDPAEEAAAKLTRLLGRPTDDRPLGSCPTGEAERLVEFAELAVLIGDREGAARFVAWDLGEPSGAIPVLQTAEGVGVGATLAAVRTAYGDRLEIATDDPFGPSFEVRVPPPGRLGGTLTGTAATDTVATLRGGAATCGG